MGLGRLIPAPFPRRICHGLVGLTRLRLGGGSCFSGVALGELSHLVDLRELRIEGLRAPSSDLWASRLTNLDRLRKGVFRIRGLTEDKAPADKLPGLAALQLHLGCIRI